MRHLNSARSKFVVLPSNNNSRILLKRLKETLSELGEAQARLNEIVNLKIIEFNNINFEKNSILINTTMIFN